ncbi:MAG: OmpA family protein [Phycisphaerae bacterium]|nr:OmpA family protein [Gemmatimonadaceae bacterium]
MRTLKTFALGAVLALSLPLTASAQRKGALEIGGFGRFTKFADTLQIDNGLGGGGRAGVFIFRNWSIEMDVSYAEADVLKRPIVVDRGDSLNTVSHTLWSYRLLYNAPISERVKLLLGAGYGYDAFGRQRNVAPRGGGPQGLVGLRFVLNDRFSLRVEGTGQYTVPGDEDTRPYARDTHFDVGGQAGLSISFFTRDPRPRIQYDTTIVTRRDTVYQTRIDTIRVPAATATTVAGRPIVIGAINFAFNKSDITDEAKKILDLIAASLNEQVNSSRTIDVTGNTDAIGSEQYNTKLGQDRADQAKAYLVSKGVQASRVNARTAGEGDPLAPNTTDNGRATNRRVLIMLTN